MGARQRSNWGTFTLLTTIVAEVSSQGLGYSLNKYDKSPAVYFEDKGTTTLYNAEWKTVVYVDLRTLDDSILNLRVYAYHVERLCQASVIANWTACAHFGNGVQERLMKLKRAKELLKEITGHEHSRRKKGGVNLVGELSKILFRTMNENDAKYYNEQIKLFEQNSTDVTTLLKQQLNVLWYSLRAVNNSLKKMDFNES